MSKEIMNIDTTIKQLTKIGFLIYSTKTITLDTYKVNNKIESTSIKGKILMYDVIKGNTLLIVFSKNKATSTIDYFYKGKEIKEVYDIKNNTSTLTFENQIIKQHQTIKPLLKNVVVVLEQLIYK